MLQQLDWVKYRTKKSEIKISILLQCHYHETRPRHLKPEMEIPTHEIEQTLTKLETNPSLQLLLEFEGRIIEWRRFKCFYLWATNFIFTLT